MNKSEIEQVYKSFRVEFRKYALKALASDEDKADDALQETLLRACIRQDRFDPRFGRQGLHAWLLAILRNVCHEMLRRPKAARVEEYDFEEHPAMETDRTDYEEVQDRLQLAQYREMIRAVAAHARLTNLEWAVIIASLNGFTNEQIGHDLGMQPRTVSTHIRNAMPRLRVAAAKCGKFSDFLLERNDGLPVPLPSLEDAPPSWLPPS